MISIITILVIGFPSLGLGAWFSWIYSSNSCIELLSFPCGSFGTYCGWPILLFAFVGYLGFFGSLYFAKMWWD
ncbi:MAG: hypothetical protein ISR65_14555 [Bacteriovoracaceae bacterium]|nr:hypothetical protein [Bacteriovoracaceae bacterium]